MTSNEPAVILPSVSLINSQSPSEYKTHVPGRYKASVSMDHITEPYRNISRVVIEKIYRNYYRYNTVEATLGVVSNGSIQ